MRSKWTCGVVIIAAIASSAACDALFGIQDLSGNAGTDGGTTNADAAPDATIHGDGGAADATSSDSGGPEQGDGGQADDCEDACAPTCTTPLSPCANTCVNLQDAGANCGACGHDCGGGVCSNGVCQTATLAQSVEGLCEIPISFIVETDRFIFS